MRTDDLRGSFSFQSIKPGVAVLGIAAILLGGHLSAQSKSGGPNVTGCDAACLTATVDDFLTKTTTQRTSAIKIAPNALVFINTEPSKLDQSPLTSVKAIRSKQIYCDPELGNVVARTGLELSDGKIAYASTRLKVVRGTITEVETSYDDSQRVNPSYVTFLDPLMTTIVPEKERASRAELKAMIERYFQTLTDHKPNATDYDDRCDRYHSGQRVTNNTLNTVETGGALTCFTSVGGNPPWGPATQIRLPVIDPKHGIVIGYTILLYKNNTPPMYVSEVFKILDGKIRMIDNIGIKKGGVKALDLPESDRK